MKKTYKLSPNGTTSDRREAKKLATERGEPLLYEGGIRRYGRSRLQDGADCPFRIQSGLRTWLDDTTDAPHHTEVLRGFYREIVPPSGKKGHDFCGYCGADNGATGELRHGWECYWCGCV